MPDIIEANEGEGSSAIANRRAQAALLAAGGGGQAGAAADNNNAAAEQVSSAEVLQVANHMARLTNGVDVRPMFRRLGVRRVFDMKYIREKDLDGLSPRVITPIQKRKIWAILKYVATDNPPLTARTTLSDIAKTLNANKKSKESSTAVAAIPTTTTSIASTAVKLDAFDGSHSKWVVWNNKSRYTLAQTNLRFLLKADDAGKAFSQKNPSLDFLLFNILAEAIVEGSAKHLIQKAEEEATEDEHPLVVAATAAAAPAARRKSNNEEHDHPASGHRLWQLLQQEYTEGPMAFWILSDARQTLQKLHLVGASNNSDNNNPYATHVVQDYVTRFRLAKDTLAEYNQALPDPFLASTFVEHIYDNHRFQETKKQLMHDVSTKSLSLDGCIQELLMSDHMLQSRHHQHMDDSLLTAIENNNNNSRGGRKRALEEDENSQQFGDDERKRLKRAEQRQGAEEEPMEDIIDEQQPDEATS